MPRDTQEYIQRFLNDKAMSNAVYSVLLQTYLKPKQYSDFHEAAAYRMATDLLQEAWKELEKHRAAVEQEDRPRQQVGL